MTANLVPAAEVAQRVDGLSEDNTQTGPPAHVASSHNDISIVKGNGPISSGTQSTRSERLAREILVPFYAGEVGGHEFLFEVCSPNRTLRGSPYIISSSVHKRQRFKVEVGSRPRFPPSVAHQFLRCFFSYVYPILPVVNGGDLLAKYSENPDNVSPLLLWSVFFAAASYLGADDIDAAGFRNRKQLKEFCYQHAKATYDAQVEPDKTTIIGSTLLLAFWYVDLEDQDGAGYWIGIAIHLCYTIGLHREPNYPRLPRCPFPTSQQALWRRLWWCAYHRDAWFCLGAGRPMRTHIDDCDLQLPTVREITDDFKDLSPELRESFVPNGLEELAELWIRLLQLSIKLEYATLHYRPRRPPLSVPQLDGDYADTLRLLTGLDQYIETGSRVLKLHANHFKALVQTVVIVLYRAYVLSTPEHLPSVEREKLQRTALQACKTAAANVTNTLNQLVAEGMIETSPATLVTPIMMTMQIHFYELAQSQGLLRQHALHNLNLHFMVLTQLKKTFWTADMHHNLFTECIKALNSGKSDQKQYAGYAAGLQDPATAARSSTPRPPRGDEQNPAVCNVLETSGLSESAFDEFFASFGPFDNFSSLFEDSYRLARLDYSNTTDAELV
ncbi:hypothetical protein H2200_005364 [Cladophialophora chaetospira]|uniref:Xylanolytic transcriptional activator regulatory domain-containing protein n=1 Tax=Cladophialophora chaetospira TaxID=386627 RepID=A0AA38XBZ0_9EURO|nr:hypothetical protein H2200_005364 [Cladophialophora chaetospira]